MQIRHLGHATFVIKSSTTLVADPYNAMIGKLPKGLAADVVTVSHQHGDHNYTQGVGGAPQIIDGVGEFSVGDFEIKGVATFHDTLGGKKRGENVVFVIRAEGLTLCHLGDLGHKLTAQQLEAIGAIDVLMIPVGGMATIGPAEAVEVVRQIKPKIVLPMHYKPKKLFAFPLATVDKFTELLGWPVQEVQELEIDKSNIDSMSGQAIVFAPRKK